MGRPGAVRNENDTTALETTGDTIERGNLGRQLLKRRHEAVRLQFHRVKTVCDHIRLGECFSEARLKLLHFATPRGCGRTRSTRWNWSRTASWRRFRSWRPRFP